MLIKSYELKNNLKSKVNVYLLYGENSELIEEVINRDIKTIFSKNLYIYEESEILSDKDNFELSLFNKSFFEKEKLIIINRSTDKILELVKNILEKNDNNIKIILKAGILEKKSKLRNFFEKSKESFIIPFYEDNHQTLQNLAIDFFKTNKIKISTQNINFILEKSKGSRVNLKNELIKIKNFSQNKTLIEFDDLVKIISSNENYKISELTDQCLAKNRNKTINILNENIASTEDNILILKSFLYKLKRLKKLKEEIEIKKNQDQVLSSYKPPIFWKEKDITKQQIYKQNSKNLKNLIFRLSEIELNIKKNANNSINLVTDFILNEVS